MSLTTIPELPARPDAATQGIATGAQSATHHLQVNIDDMPVGELLELRSRIDSKLPARRLQDIDLEQELVLQLLATQDLQRVALANSETPANQLAQVSNAVQAALQNLVKLQGEVFTTERLKRLELLLLEAVKTLPVQEQDRFLTAYEQMTESL